MWIRGWSPEHRVGLAEKEKNRKKLFTIHEEMQSRREKEQYSYVPEFEREGQDNER